METKRKNKFAGVVVLIAIIVLIIYLLQDKPVQKSLPDFSKPIYLSCKFMQDRKDYQYDGMWNKNTYDKVRDPLNDASETRKKEWQRGVFIPQLRWEGIYSTKVLKMRL